MAAALLPGLLLLALSRGFPPTAADSKGFSCDLPSIVYLKPSQSPANVTFKIMFENNIEKNVTFSPEERWHRVELSLNEKKHVVLSIPPPVSEEFTCCTGKNLTNYHASYNGKVQWSEECPEEYCPVTESSTSDTSDHHKDALSTLHPGTKPSIASDTGSSTTTKPKPLEMILWITLPTVIGITTILAVFVACCLYTKDQPLSGASYPPSSELNNGAESEEEEAV